MKKYYIYTYRDGAGGGKRWILNPEKSPLW